MLIFRRQYRFQNPPTTNVNTQCGLGNARPCQPPPLPDQFVYFRRLGIIGTTPQRLYRHSPPSEQPCPFRSCLFECVCLRARARHRSIKRTTVYLAALQLFCCYTPITAGQRHYHDVGPRRVDITHGNNLAEYKINDINSTTRIICRPILFLVTPYVRTP